MPRLPRLQYPGAIYNVVTRGDGRRKVFHDEGHYGATTNVSPEGWPKKSTAGEWIVIAYCWMPNHVYALIKTPQPNLCRGMQRWLSGYANWYAKRNRRTGHLFQGRYKAFLVEDDGYYWNLSRYIHLNPYHGSSPLAETPEAYRHSSYGGYARKSRQVDWVAYEDHHRYWAGLHGGKDPAAAYRKFVKEGLASPPDPKLQRLRDWVYGGEDFLKRMLAMACGEDEGANCRRRRRMNPVTVDAILDATARQYETSADQYCGFRSRAGGRDVAAMLCRRWTTATLRELSARFGLTHPDSASDLIGRGKRSAESNREVGMQVASIEQALGLNPESRVCPRRSCPDHGSL